jgi:hypothetical protein
LTVDAFGILKVSGIIRISRALKAAVGAVTSNVRRYWNIAPSRQTMKRIGN